MPAKTQKTRASRPARAVNTRKKTTTKLPRRSFLSRNVLILIVILALVGVVLLMRSNAATTLPGGKASWQRFPGDPNPKVTGKRYWGSSVGGNGDPVRHEAPSGKSLSVRRTFWGWDNNRTSMITTIKADLANNRLPYVSTKTPKWAEVAAGKHDAALDDMLKKVDATGGPVWLTFFHEPEDDTETPTKSEKCNTEPGHAPCSGTAQDWRNMQVHIRERMKALGTKNIAFMPTLMAWTFDPASRRDPENYYVPGIWDSYMVDAYVASDKGTPVTNTQWVKFVSWAEAKGIPFGIGEWGNNFAVSNQAKEMRDFWEWSFANNKDMIGYAYFDSGLNGGKELSGEALTEFQRILGSDNRVLRINEIPTISPTNPTDPTDNGGGTDTGSLSIGIVTPSSGATVSGITKVNAGPDTNVQSVSFRLDGVWQTTDDAAPFAWDWNTVTAANGEHTVTIRARKVGDPGNVYTEKSIKVIVKNGTTTPTSPTDSQAPSVPANVSASLRFDWTKARYVVDIKWTASTDDVAVSQYQVVRDFTILGNSKTTAFTDSTNLETGKTYRYSVSAVDASGKVSKPGSVSIKTNCFLVWCSAEVVQ